MFKYEQTRIENKPTPGAAIQSLKNKVQNINDLCEISELCGDCIKINYKLPIEDYEILVTQGDISSELRECVARQLVVNFSVDSSASVRALF